MAARGHFPPAHCPSCAPGSHRDSRTSRLVSICRFLASNSTDPSPIGKILHKQTGTEEGICGTTTQKKRKKEKKKKPIFQGDPVEDPLLPPPYVTLTPQALAQPAPDSLPDSLPHHPPVSPAPPHEQDSSPEPVGKWLCSAKQSN